LPLLHEGVGDVFEEDQTQDLMLVFSGIPLGTEFVRWRPGRIARFSEITMALSLACGVGPVGVRSTYNDFL